MFRSLFWALLALLASLSPLHADEAAPLGALARMPVKEVTVFKDGHAFVLHQGTMPTDEAGNIILDQLPTPVMGTFWPFSSEKNAPLISVTAGRKRVRVERTALTLRELLEANPGADVSITERCDKGGEKAEKETKTYTGTLIGFPTRSASEL
jgi:hypothetical protein